MKKEPYSLEIPASNKEQLEKPKFAELENWGKT